MNRPKVSPARLKIIAQRRLETLQRFRRLVKNHGAKKAARTVGVSIPTLWRWARALAHHGESGLFPKNYKSGRRSPFSQVRLSPKAIRELELLFVEHRQTRAAWRQFAGNNASCPPLVANYVQRFGRPPAQFTNVIKINEVKARCFISTDGRRLFVKLPAQGTIMARLTIPAGFKLQPMK